MTAMPLCLFLAFIQASDRGINANSTAAGFIVIGLIAMMIAVMVFIFVKARASIAPRR